MLGVGIHGPFPGEMIRFPRIGVPGVAIGHGQGWNFVWSRLKSRGGGFGFNFGVPMLIVEPRQPELVVVSHRNQEKRERKYD